MNFSRREFLKATMAAVAGYYLPIQLLAEHQDGIFGEALRKVWGQTTLHRTLKVSSQGLNYGKGEALTLRNDLLRRTVAVRSNPRTLMFFGQITDFHILDEESPARLVAAEEILQPLGIGSAFRPQEDLVLWAMDAMMRTFNKISNEKSFDFLLNSGDSIDNAQQNELEWFLTAIQGGLLDPDSGANEDPVPGAGNDANDPFMAAGLLNKVPYYSAIGNHDVLFQGNIPIELREIYNDIVGELIDFMAMHNPVGDYSNAVITPSGEAQNPSKLKAGKVVADPRRMGIEGRNFIQQHLVLNHDRPMLGFPKQLAGKELAYYAVHPKKDAPIKMIVLDTTSRIGGAEGLIDEEQFHKFLVPELEQSKAENELVMIVSHHPASSLWSLEEMKQNYVNRFGRNEKLQKMTKELVSRMNSRCEFIDGQQFVQTLQKYPNVFLHVAGHRHANVVTPMKNDNRGYWEVQTCSLMGFPQQARLFDIVYEGNGIGAVQTCVVDHESAKGSLADRCREIALQDEHSSLNSAGSLQDRNTVLRFEIPAEIAKKLES